MDAAIAMKQSSAGFVGFERQVSGLNGPHVVETILHFPRNVLVLVRALDLTDEPNSTPAGFSWIRRQPR